MNKNLFISESYVGTHANIAFYESDLLSFAFIPIIKKENDNSIRCVMPKIERVWINSIQAKFSDIQLIRYEKYFIGFDLDRQGNLMAIVFKKFLLSLGVAENMIFRTPLTERGYLTICRFMNEAEFNKEVVDRYRDKIITNKTKRFMSMGRRKILAYLATKHNKGFVKNINSSGTSSITYITKKKVKEK